jgi:uncharacterized protein (TIGR00288 family)
MPETERSLALFVDFENLALGFQGRRERFEIEKVLKRMVEKGKIVAKKAYADWNRYSSYTEALHEAAIELVEIPRRGQSGKNSADIRLCVDAMDLAYSKEHIDTFVVVSGDSDFSPLVSKLKENGKHVIGLGMQNSTSELLRDNCDEFIYYEDLEEPTAEIPALDPQIPEMKRKAFALLLDSLLALRRENKEVLWSSMVKDTMKRKKPAFNETYHGYRSFSALLEDAQEHKFIELDVDKRSGTYVVTRFGDEMKGEPRVATGAYRESRPSRGGRGRRRGGEGRRGGRTIVVRPEPAEKPVPQDGAAPVAETLKTPPAAVPSPAPEKPVEVNGGSRRPPREEPKPPPRPPEPVTAAPAPAPRPAEPPVERKPPPPPPAPEKPKAGGFGSGIFDDDGR